MKALTGRDWLQVGDAAALLGVSEKTLRNWDKAGKLRPARHPINGYRIYRAADLHALRREMVTPKPLQLAMDLGATPITGESTAQSEPSAPRLPSDVAAMHWRAEVALDPKHRPQLWDKPSSTVRRDWRKYPQEAHVLDQDCARYRRLTPAEVACLQGFDPGIVGGMPFSNRQLIAALGNAVPPPLAVAVFTAVAEARQWRNRTAIEICAGIGGLTRGATGAQFEHLMCLDIDPICLPFLERLPELSEAQILAQDLRYTDFSKYRGKVGVLSGGPPCQPWSSGGLRRGSEDDRDVLGEMPKLIAEVQPEAFIFENVAGLTMGQNKRYFDGLVKSLKDADGVGSYGVLAAKLNAADFGVPQVRERVFIIGLKDQPASAVHACFNRVWSLRTHRDPTVPDQQLPEWRTVGDALSKLDDPGGWRAWFGQNVSEELDWVAD